MKISMRLLCILFFICNGILIYGQVKLNIPTNLSPNNFNVAANTTSFALSWTKNNNAGIANYEVKVTNTSTGVIILNH